MIKTQTNVVKIGTEKHKGDVSCQEKLRGNMRVN